MSTYLADSFFYLAAESSNNRDVNIGNLYDNKIILFSTR